MATGHLKSQLELASGTKVDGAAQAARIASLWNWPLIPDGQIHEALGIAESQWAAQKRIGDTPPLFTIGRRLFVRSVDLLQWVNDKAAVGKPGSKARRAEAAP
jgi:hypothetical protein